MRRASALILGLHGILQHDEEPVPELITKQSPDTPDKIIHVQRHYICTSCKVILVGYEEIRHWKGPLCRCYRNEQVLERAQPYFFSA